MPKKITSQMSWQIVVRLSTQGTHKMRKLFLAVLAVLGISVISACGLLGGMNTPPQQPIINNITPNGSDSGLTILLTVVGISAFLLLGTLVLVASYAMYERRRRQDAEIAVETLTGQPIRQLRMIIRAPVSIEQLHTVHADNLRQLEAKSS